MDREAAQIRPIRRVTEPERILADLQDAAEDQLFRLIELGLQYLQSRDVELLRPVRLAAERTAQTITIAVETKRRLTEALAEGMVLPLEKRP